MGASYNGSESLVSMSSSSQQCNGVSSETFRAPRASLGAASVAEREDKKRTETRLECSTKKMERQCESQVSK